MRVAAIYPQGVALDPKIQHAIGEPTGLEYIAAVAKEEGHQTELFVPVVVSDGGGSTSLSNMPEGEFIENIASYSPDVAAFSLMTCQFNRGKRIAAALKKRNPNLTTIAGGRFPSGAPYMLNGVFDFFVIGEGEETFRELLTEVYNGNDSYGKVKGISFRDSRGHITITSRRELISDLDSLPRSLRDESLLKQTYRGVSIPPLSHNPRYALIEYSRGCPGVCRFCDAELFWKKRVRHRSAKNVVEEMKYLAAEHGTELFYMYDLDFTISHRKVFEFCEEISKQGLKTSWYCMSNIVTANEEVLRAMKEAGCFKVAWGVESTNNISLGKMNKGFSKSKSLTKEQAMDTLEISAKIGIVNNIYYITGFPWETEESILEDARTLNEYCAHQLNVGIFTPIPCSRLYNEMDKSLLHPNLDLHDRNHLVFEHDNLTHEKMKEIQEKMHMSFYQSPAYSRRVRELIKRNPLLRQSFSEYYEFIGLDIRL